MVKNKYTSGEEAMRRGSRPVGKDDPRNPGMDIRYAGVPDMELPRTESLKDAVGRVMPYWECIIFPALMYKDSLLVVAHGNSLRGIIKHLKGFPIRIFPT